MRFHVVSLPHTQTTMAFSSCAFTEKVRKFCKMMAKHNTVYLYAGDQNEAPCHELITCVTEEERKEAEKSYGHYTAANFNPTLPYWVRFNSRVVDALRTRLQPRDFICLIGGTTQACIAQAYPNHITVEFGIGYPGTFSKYRVWESYAWMHTCYGAEGKSDRDGNWFDTVIPSYFEPELFPFSEEKENYYLYLGRLTQRKGYQIAIDVCKKIGAPLKVAGFGDKVSDCEYLGVVGAEERGKLLSKATALFVPTIYIEPFGSVAVEAMLCGTPVITSDWGAFTETVQHDVTGYRCRSFKDFVTAAELVKKLDPRVIHEYAVNNYSLDVIGLRYDEYFDRLSTLWEKGWYQL